MDENKTSGVEARLDRGPFLVLNRLDVEDAVMRGYDMPVDSRMLTSADEAETKCREFNSTCKETDRFQVYWLLPIGEPNKL